MFAPLEVRMVFITFLLTASFKESVGGTDKKLPLVINTWAFIEANRVGWDVLHRSTTGNSVLDAVVEGCTTCERLQCDGTVGYGGSPDENGETTLDAMIMDGSNMNIGAVASLREIKDAIKVARHVLENTQHTLLVGDAATSFAVMMGFHRESLSTVTSKEIWKKWHNSNCQPNFWINVLPDASQSCGPYTPMEIHEDSRYFGERKSYSINRWNHDTIGMIVIDETGKIYAGTSTNGARHKIQGRVGDSPIPGAGAYADNEVGAAVATGDGDIMMRFLPSLLAVEYLRGGQTPEESANLVMLRILRFYPNFSGGLIVTDKYGNYSAACVGLEKFPFSVVFGDAKQTSRVEHVECERSRNYVKVRDEFK